MSDGVHVVEHFLRPLLDAFGKPFKTEDDTKRCLEQYARLLRQYTPSELKGGADRVLLKHMGPHRWPRINECVAACEDERKRLRAEEWVRRNPAKAAAVPLKPERTPEEIAQTQQYIIDCAEGRIELGFCAHLLRDLAKQIRRREGF